MTGTAFPIWVYFGNSLSKIDSLGFPALLIPPVVLLPANKYQSGNVCNLAHSLTVNDLGWEKWTKSSAKEQAVIFGPFSFHFFGRTLCANFLVTDKKKEVLIPANGRILISTGLAIEIPKNCEGQIRSRSGLSFDHGIIVLNSPGTIDQDFRGHLKIILANFGIDDYLIRQGDRIAQLVIINVVRPQIRLVEKLNASKRGNKGFGSTGIT